MEGKFLLSFCLCHVEAQTANLWTSFLVVLTMVAEIFIDKVPKQQRAVSTKDVDLSVVRLS